MLRGGFGIFFGQRGTGYVNVSQPGFNQRTNVISSLDNGVTYIASISNPLPLGVQRPAGASGGLTAYLERSPAFISSDGHRPYTERWSYSIQFQPEKQSTVELGYLGSRSVRQRVSTEFNSVPRQYLSTSPVRDQPVIDFLSGKVTNPFVGIAGFAGSALYSSVNTTVSQLLLPYPQFTGLATDLPAGSSWYNALTAPADFKSKRHTPGRGPWRRSVISIRPIAIWNTWFPIWTGRSAFRPVLFMRSPGARATRS